MRHKYGSLCFICLDNSNGFWGIKLKLDKRPYTAFVHKSHQYMFKVLPMGIHNSPAIYTKILQNELSHFSDQHAKIYLYVDDILLLVPETHCLQILEKFLKWLNDRNFVISLPKLQLFKQEVEYLGYKLNMDGLTTDRKKMADLFNMKNPTTKTEAQIIAGMAAFNRHHIPYLQYILKPIHEDLVKSKGKIPIIP